jgi:hypothetical protein
VVEHVEVLVVDPHGMIGDGHARELLAEARRPEQARLRDLEDPVELEAAVRAQQRTALEDPHGAHVHVDARGLEVEKGRVERGETVVVAVGHVT